MAAFSVGATHSSAQVAHAFAIGLAHAKAKPYNFTGRVFILDEIGFGSATLLRRHTALTAGHVVYDPGTGFFTRLTFSRGLYGTFTSQKEQAIALNALSGYATIAGTQGPNTLNAFERDLGDIVFQDAPFDEDWGIYNTDTKLLTDSSGKFVLGYSGETFDGRTQTYVVPPTPYVGLGALDSGLYENDDYAVEGGMSGGPVYSFSGGVQQVVAETVGGTLDTSNTFNASLVRAVNKEAGSFLVSAEYASGLIKKVKISGPTTVQKGSTVTFTTKIKFTVKNALTGGSASTDRYNEIQLVSDVVGTPTQPAVTIKKIANNTFQVTFASTLRSRSLITLTAQYAANSPVAKSSLVVTVQ